MHAVPSTARSILSAADRERADTAADLWLIGFAVVVSCLFVLLALKKGKWSLFEKLGIIALVSSAFFEAVMTRTLL